MGPVAPDEYRQPSVTARCLTEDMGLEVPIPEQAARAELDHPLLRELVRLTPTSPQSQQAIQALHAAGFPAFRARVGRWRGCTFHELEMIPEVVWLCAAEFRRAGDDDDAYEHFLRLHEADRLRPTDADRTAAVTEELIWYVFPRAAEMAYDAIRDAINYPEVPIQSSDPTLPVAVVAVVVQNDEYGVADIFLGFDTPRTPVELGTTYMHGEMLRLIADLLQAPDEWERGYHRSLPHHLTAVYRTTIGV